MSGGIEDLRAVRRLLVGLPVPWCVCGGWAIDLFTGGPQRDHKDVDVAVWRRDRDAVRAYFSGRGWSLEKAHEGTLEPWDDKTPLAGHEYTVWCRHATARPGFVELLFNDVRDGEFRFRRDPSVTLPEARAVVELSNGFRVLAPEICLLYKAPYDPDAEPEHERDFCAVLPHLDGDRRAWLGAGLRRLYPNHRWLKAL